MKNRLLRAPAALLALGALSLAARAGDGNVVKLATLVPKGSSLERILLAMGEQLRAAPEGGITLKLYVGGKIGSESDVVSKMRIKQLQAGLLTAAGLGQIDESILALQNLPLVYRDADEVRAVREELAPLIEKKFEAKGFKLLFLGDIGFVRFFSKAPVRVPDDLKKMRIFTLPGDVRQVDLMKSLGLNPQPLEPVDILPSLQTGLIDCVPMIPFYTQVQQLYKPAPYMLDLDWAPLVGGCVMLKEVFDSFPPKLQEAVLKVSASTGAEVMSRNRIEGQESIAAMIKGGLKVTTPTPAEVQTWRDFLAPVYPKLRGGLLQAEMYDLVMETLRKHREGSTTPGQKSIPPGGSPTKPK